MKLPSMPAPPSYLAPLKAKIVQVGGPGRFQIDPYVANNITEKFATMLIAEATALGPTDAIIQGNSRACHQNSLEYVAANGGALWSGFALSDECWRVHSWVVKDGKVLETTAAREKYVGLDLNTTERVLACFPQEEP